MIVLVCYRVFVYQNVVVLVDLFVPFFRAGQLATQLVDSTEREVAAAEK